MPPREDTRTLAVVSACMTASGTPDFVLHEVLVTQEEVENGIHYYLVEAQLLEAGYEEPLVHVEEAEAPAFLHPAVRQYLGLPAAVAEPTPVPILEECSWPASSK